MIQFFKRREYPFKLLYRHISPKDFAYLFQSEAFQTIAFILSFSRSRGYIQKVLRIMDQEELTEVVKTYLVNMADDKLDLEFTRRVEIYTEKLVGQYDNLILSKRLRRNTIRL